MQLFVIQNLLIFLSIYSIAARVTTTNVNFFNDYYFVLTSNANESFGFSMAPYEKNGIISLIVGAPRSSNNLPAKAGVWLGGLFECSLDQLDCGMNQIVNLDLRDWSLSNFGFSVASTFASEGGGSSAAGGSGSSIAVCDPRARLFSSKDPVEGIGLCFLLRPDLRSPGDLRQGAATFMPSLIRQDRTPMPNMLFGSSVAALPSGDAYAFGFPYLLLGFGGTVFMSAFNASLLSTTGSQSPHLLPAEPGPQSPPSPARRRTARTPVSPSPARRARTPVSPISCPQSQDPSLPHLLPQSQDPVSPISCRRARTPVSPISCPQSQDPSLPHLCPQSQDPSLPHLLPAEPGPQSPHLLPAEPGPQSPPSPAHRARTPVSLISCPQSQDPSLRRHPVSFWGHSYTGGFEAVFAELRQKPSSHVTRLTQAQEDRFYDRLLENKVRSYSCAGFAVATSNRLFGASSGFDLAEGAPCPPEPLVHPVSFRPGFINQYRYSFAADAAAANASYFSGVVRLYSVAGSSEDLCGREGGLSDSRWYDQVNCFPDSSLRATLQGPGSFAGRFGHALLLLDLNADGWDDLVVAAPADLSVRRPDGAYWTVGAVYVYMSGGPGKFIADNAQPSYRLSFPSCEALADTSDSSQSQSLLARLCRSSRHFELRFGWSLARLGDIDRDGLEDFAVGAPLAGTGGGAVVVFKGSRDGPPRLGQIVVNADAAGFGESVSPGADFDSSGRPDLVVAAPRHADGKVYFYPARYVVQFDLTPLGSLPARIPRDRPGSLVLRPALDPGSRLNYSLQVQFFVDTWPGLAKPRFRPLNLGPNNTLIGNEADVTSPVQVEAVWLSNPASPGRPGPVPKAAKSALLSAPHLQGLRQAEGEKFHLQNISWNHSCSGLGPRCLSQLSVTCQSNATRDPASKEPALLITGDADSALEILCRIVSTGEPAYNAYLRLQFDSAALVLAGAWVRTGAAGFQPAAMSNSQGGKLILGNPAARDTTVRLLFKPLSVRCDVASVDFQFTALTSSDLAPGSAAVWQTRLRVRTELSISMQAEFSASLGYQNQTLLGFNAFQGSLYKLTSPRRLPELYVTLANRAAAYLPSSYLLIHWPIETVPMPGETHGKYLMYLQTLPYIQHTGSGPGDRLRTPVTCNAAQLAAIRNPLRLKPDDIDSCRQAGQAAGYSAVNVSDSVRLPEASLPPPLVANRTNPGPACSRRQRFDFTYSCANSRCLPLLCQLGELSTRTEPLQLTFSTVAYQFTFIEDNLLCSSVSIVPSVQWLPGPEFADRVAIRAADPTALAACSSENDTCDSAPDRVSSVGPRY
uniref:Integrin_alpha2 domain-containing protein n=1 Tax=Macrostomum lignano TaxID=282301 RepID=A0A1I8J9P5_9PLAT